MIVSVPNLEPNTLEISEMVENPKSEYAYGSRQKRMENFNALVEFLETWKKTTDQHDKCRVIAERFCNLNFQYGYVSRNDIVQQALMKANLI